MSMESARAFYERTLTDSSLRVQLQNATLEERGKIIKDLDYDFYQEEWNLLSAEINKIIEAQDEISDAELEAVAGGSLWTSLDLKFLDKIINPPIPLYGLSQTN